LRTSWLGRIFGSKRDESVGGWRELHNELLRSSANIIIMIKSKRMGPLGHAARIGRRNLLEKPERNSTMKVQKEVGE
jgi:hypothetical protein